MIKCDANATPEDDDFVVLAQQVSESLGADPTLRGYAIERMQEDLYLFSGFLLSFGARR